MPPVPTHNYKPKHTAMLIWNDGIKKQTNSDTEITQNDHKNLTNTSSLRHITCNTLHKLFNGNDKSFCTMLNS